MKTIDTTGNLCPKPLIMVKKAMEEINVGDSLKILTDNDTSFKNLTNYLKDQGAIAGNQKEGDVYIISTQKPHSFSSSKQVEDYCETVPLPSNYVIRINSDKMGDGPDELGDILLRAFINTIEELDHLPTHIILYNSAVKLSTDQYDVSETLEKLEEKGIRIMVCGTCVDYFGLQDKIKVGMISNMYVIAEVLTTAGKVITP